MGVSNGGPKSGSQIGVPNGGPKWGVPNGGPNQGPISPSVLKCQNVKMIKWPNGQMAKCRDRRSECAKSDSKAYGTKLRAIGKNMTNIQIMLSFCHSFNLPVLPGEEVFSQEYTSMSWPSSSGLNGHSRTYLTILE
jgi:hypothetical protein